MALKKAEVVYVEYDPVHGDEFPGCHLSIILKKNKDGNTYKVAPITTSDSGLGDYKVSLGKLQELPPRLNQDISYLSYEHVRTVDIHRIKSIKEGRFFLSDANFFKVSVWCAGQYEKIIPEEHAELYYLSRYEKIIFKRIKDNAYNLLKNQNDINDFYAQAILKDSLKLQNIDQHLESVPDKIKEIILSVTCKENQPAQEAVTEEDITS